MILQFLRLFALLGVILIVGSANFVSSIISADISVPEEKIDSEITFDTPLKFDEAEEVVEDDEKETPSSSDIEVDSDEKNEISEVEEVIVVNSKLPVIAEITVNTSSIIKSRVEALPEIETIPINSESIVGLNCFYKHNPTGQIFNTGRGSGVIIHPNGFVLTARHVIDFSFGLELGGGTDAELDLARESSFERCDVGVPPKSTSLPDASTIRSVNPSTQLPVLGYTAEIAQPLPLYTGKTYAEMLTMDFAVLRINGISADGPFFGISVLPSSFGYSTLLTEKSFPPIGDEILTYGFPGDTTSGKLATFNTLYLVGSVGKVDKIFSDGFIQTAMEISGGRSGSPLFWKGRVAGIVTSYLQGNRALSQSMSVSSILDSIKSFLP